jgi:hypothetical protein
MPLPNYLPTGTRYAGTDVIQTIQLGSGGIVDGVSGIAGRMDYIQTLMLPVTAVANTDFTMSVPPGATLLSATVYTSVAYTGATATIQIGNAAASAAGQSRARSLILCDSDCSARAVMATPRMLWERLSGHGLHPPKAQLPSQSLELFGP